MTRTLASLLGMCAAVVAWEAHGLLTLREAGVQVRFEPVPEAVFDELGRDGPLRPLRDTAYIRAELRRNGHPGHGRLDLLRWTMDQVERAEVSNPGSARRALEIARAGGGLSCGPLADIYQHALTVEGYRARRIQLARSLFNMQDTHVTVEVLVDGKWVIFDPTFHLSFTRNGRLLGAADIHRALRDGTHGGIEPLFHGEVRYPVRVETYYTDWLPLYNNVAVLDAAPRPLWARLPPLRYWHGPSYYVLQNEAQPLWQVEAANRFYFLYVAALPMVAALLFIATAFLWLVDLRRTRPSEG